MARPIWCRKCGTQAVMVAGALPIECVECGISNHWTTHGPPPEPVLPDWRLTPWDYRFLRTQRIAVDDPVAE